MVHESTGREHVEDLCNKANEAKLQHTAVTPFMTGDLQEDVGWVGIGPSVCMMLDGTYDPPEEMDEYTKKLITQFRQNRKATEHDPLYKITPEEWKSFWKGATEWTSCGCDILHFGNMESRIIQWDHYGTGCSTHRHPTANWIFSAQMVCSHRCPALEESWSTSGRETAHNCPLPRLFQLPE
jgi:hypothetical protein